MSTLWFARGMRLLGSTVLVWALAACTAVQLSYNNADVLARFMASDYTDLSADQSARFRERFAALHGWHRQQELPAYAQLLRTTGERIDRGLTAGDVRWAIETVRQRYHRLLARAVEEGAPLLASLTSEQHAQLEKKFAENNRKYARDNLEGDERRLNSRRASRLNDYFSDWVGRLSDAQEDRIAQFAPEHGRAQALRMEDRRRRQREALAILRSERDPAVLARRLAPLLVSPEGGRSAEYEAAMARYETKVTELVIDIDKSLSPEQRARAVRRAKRYSDDFAALAGTASATAQPVHGEPASSRL